MKKLLFIAILSLTSTLALADIGDNFFSIKLGSSNSKNAGITTAISIVDKVAEMTNNDLGSSDILGIGVGKYFSETFRGEINISQRKGFKYATTHTKNDGVPETEYRYKADIESLTFFC